MANYTDTSSLARFTDAQLLNIVTNRRRYARDARNGHGQNSTEHRMALAHLTRVLDELRTRGRHDLIAL